VTGTPGHDEQLTAVLRQAQDLHFLGDRPIPEVIEHARSYCTALTGVAGRVLDLGSGGGVPGLVIAHDRPDLEVVLLDRRTKRTDFLERAVRRLRCADRVVVVAAEATEYLRTAAGTFDAAVARGFGPGEITLHFGTQAVESGGLIVISEPPEEEPDRWPDELLADLRVERGRRIGTVTTFLKRGL
jgi:16S rRNA (guanine527-N7)-methyltransferase